MAVTFCGHGQIDARKSVESWLRAVVAELIAEGETLFYVGDRGDFDHMTRCVLNEAKAYHPQITVLHVQAYLTEKVQEEGLESVYPPLENVPLRYAISRRNQWMVEQADTVVAYVIYDWGGAAKTLLYAQRKKRRIIRFEKADKGKDFIF